MSMHHDMRRPIAAMCVTAGAAPIGSGAGIVSSQIQIHKHSMEGGKVRLASVRAVQGVFGFTIPFGPGP